MLQVGRGCWQQALVGALCIAASVLRNAKACNCALCCAALLPRSCGQLHPLACPALPGAASFWMPSPSSPATTPFWTSCLHSGGCGGVFNSCVPSHRCHIIHCQMQRMKLHTLSPLACRCLSLPACSGEACSQMLGFHFFRCREDAAAQRLATPAPSGLYLAAAKMVRAGYTTLEALMAHLTPADDDLKQGEQACCWLATCSCSSCSSCLHPASCHTPPTATLAGTHLPDFLLVPPRSLHRGLWQDAGGH